MSSLLLQLNLAWLLLRAAELSAAAPQLALPDCEDRCGNISVPYPFGMTQKCYIDGQFLVTCNDTHHNPPKLFLMSSNIEITDIFLSGEMRISTWVGYNCYNKQGIRGAYLDTWIITNRFLISNTRNKFTAVGCDTSALIKDKSGGQKYATGCMSLCDSVNNVINGSCSGIGCCQTSIPKGVRSFKITISSYYEHKGVWDFNPCSYAFVAEETSYNFSSLDLADLRIKREKLPVVLDWAVGSQSCGDAEKNLASYACKRNSYCNDSHNGPGYRCYCSDGYEGNPYLPTGCTDIDECSGVSSPCNMTCHNLPGTYNCSCLEGYEGDGTKNGTGCSPIPHPNKRIPWINIALGSTVAIITIFVIIISSVYWGIQRRKTKKLKDNFFKKNGGLMLQQLLSNSKSEGSSQRAKIFTEEELNKATNNFSESNVVGEGGFGTVYKGILPNGLVVAIKKSKVVDRNQTEQFVNEVIILSQIKHPNVVKLLGCCLETPVPLLVYEFITNNTLFHHIHGDTDGFVSSMPWEMRLRIATETAAALAHMHSAPMHIIHRDVKSANILLDDKYTAKVSDFGVSRLVPLDQTQLPTFVQGTFGYIDPEYFYSGMLTKKSDVYSFGVVLVELLTGEKVLSNDRLEKDRSLAAYFMSSLEENCLDRVIDIRVKEEGDAEQIEGVAKLAKNCLRLKGDKRPSMMEVREKLETLGNREKKNSWVKIASSLEESEPLLSEPFNSSGSGTVPGLDSLTSQVVLHIDDGR